VRTPEGGVRLDSTGKQAGRGAYLCDDPACWRASGLRQRLGNALKTTVSDEDFQSLQAHAATLAPEPSHPEQ
jgi:hypothetical protein